MAVQKATMILLYHLISATTAHTNSDELNIVAADAEQQAREMIAAFANDVDYIKTEVNRSENRLDQLLPHDYVRYIFDKTTSAVHLYAAFFVGSASGRPAIANDSLRGKRIEILNRLVGMFEIASTISREQCRPFGGLDCNLFPVPINHTISPPLAKTFEALSDELKKVRANVADNVTVKAVENYRGFVPVCKIFDIDHYLGWPVNMMAKGCQKADLEEGSVGRL
ncbi:hypothetical protein AAVH_28721, partial [Aphelenchoides avenae]